ncbi:annexin [Spirosoma endbachense]|uniref:Uncharacterized protein n=1 Tax=Spirosoma endbachense TaxID=2666025 RepID=A0A6P1VZ23_9BACT|nr:annexin [Spirosoma endbachense]QHV97568.1 hypothetical protein GJR95_22290 [Spirosoma endbachense]
MSDKLKELNDGGYNNILLMVLALVGVYLLISGFGKSKQQTYLDTAGTDLNTQQAQALRDAMNRSGVKLLMSVDGTDVDLIMQTAQQIRDYSKVSDSYRVLYSSELTTDLQSELSRTDLQNFWNIVYKTTPTSNPATNPTANVGRKVTANQTVNIRVDKAPYGTVRQAQKGELLGTYTSERVLPDIPNKGDTNLFVKYDQPVTVPFVGTLYSVPYWVLKSAVNLS